MLSLSGRFDVVTSEVFEARQKTHAPRSREMTISRPPLQVEVIPPPRSMIADGGTPARRYPAGASVAETTAMIRAYAAEQALANAETARRLAALERDNAETDRRLAELENRRATAVTAVQAFASMFSLVYNR
jgi:hypothetical protein